MTTAPWTIGGLALLTVAMLANVAVLLVHIARNRRQAGALMGARFPALYLFHAGSELVSLLLVLSMFTTGLWSMPTLVLLYLTALGWAHATERQIRTNLASERHWRTPELAELIADTCQAMREAVREVAREQRG